MITFFRYSAKLQKWGVENVQGNQCFLYICEVSINKESVVTQEQSDQDGLNIINTQKDGYGPYFIKQPSDVVVDDSKNPITDYVILKYVYILYMHLSGIGLIDVGF